MSTKNITIPQPLVRFIDEVVEVARSQTDRQRAIDLIDPLLKELLNRPDFLTEDFTRPIPDKVAQYLIYRSEDRSLSVMAMVVPVGCTTPIHDHLAWGLVGVYQGTQLETVYRRTDDGADSIRARLVQVCANVLEVGDITHLLPPEGDIHKIETISQDQASVSIHILGNDIGCQWRHAFDMEKEAVYDFRSGYVNADCDD